MVAHNPSTRFSARANSSRCPGAPQGAQHETRGAAPQRQPHQEPCDHPRHEAHEAEPHGGTHRRHGDEQDDPRRGCDGQCPAAVVVEFAAVSPGARRCRHHDGLGLPGSHHGRRFRSRDPPLPECPEPERFPPRLCDPSRLHPHRRSCAPVGPRLRPGPGPNHPADARLRPSHCCPTSGDHRLATDHRETLRRTWTPKPRLGPRRCFSRRRRHRCRPRPAAPLSLTRTLPRSLTRTLARSVPGAALRGAT